MAEEREDAAAVEAVVAADPILPAFRALGRATSDRNEDVVEDAFGSGWPSVVTVVSSGGQDRMICCAS